jgi:rubrerythrin
MANTETTAELFEMAIAAEKAAEELYFGFEERFAHHQDVVAFWRKYAEEEVGHARWLEGVRDKSSPEQLSAPADPSILKDARKFLRFSPQHALEGVTNLEDAYQLANELENSEINVVFEFIITNFSADESAGSFLRAQLKDHIARLMTEFPARFSHSASRQAVKVLAQT